MDGSLVEEAGPQPLDSRVPVTVLTGFLGSGKTTLLNRILTENHGQRIAVIENEFGEIGIDQDLVISAEEEIFEMNNGCICCTVRGDLIRILGNLMRRRDRFDAVLIETTGMADPGPVVQTFFMDAEMARSMRLDAIVTIVDAGHLALHLGEQPEVEEQIAFADVVLLNKTDLVAPAVVDAIEAALRSINATAPIHRTVQAEIDLDRVLGVDGFSLDRALEIDPEFLEPEYPFEWAGVYEQPAGRLEFVVPPGPDNAMMAALLPLPRPTLEALDALLPEASALFSASRANGELLPPGSTRAAE
ncbi:MAG: CobW family GTP-binding protein, partial [Chloroflexota bacterium]